MQKLNRANELVKKQTQIKDMMELAKTYIIVRKPVVKGLKVIFGQDVSESYIDEVNEFAENKLVDMLKKKYNEVTEEFEKI